MEEKIKNVRKKKVEKIEEVKIEEPETTEMEPTEKIDLKKKTEEKKSTEKKKKSTAQVNGYNIPISTKVSIAICKFIKNKKTSQAISDLEKVRIGKKAVPMKGEIPHRKGKGMMSGRFPKKASEHFIKLLKSASANAISNNIENPVVIEAIANIGSRPHGRFGNIRRKRTHIKIVVGNKHKTKK